MKINPLHKNLIHTISVIKRTTIETAVLLLVILLVADISFAASKGKKETKEEKIAKAFAQKVSVGAGYRFKCDSVMVDKTMKTMRLLMSTEFSYIPFREENTNSYYLDLKNIAGKKFKNYHFSIETTGREIGTLIPNFYRSSRQAYDAQRVTPQGTTYGNLTFNSSKNQIFTNGLSGRNIALWHSHGWYYNHSLDRWEWQRARLFLTVEDLWTMSFIVPYITPMLENAGANVFLPRERDVQLNEVIVDADGSSEGSETLINGNWTVAGKGFGLKVPFLIEGDNLFNMGNALQIQADAEGKSTFRYIPDIPETGDYALSVSYLPGEQFARDARYTVYHSGGKTEFKVNQQMGGRTWIYLGTFRFEKGKDETKAMVELTNQSAEAGKWISADAVKFGGGMGNVVRGSSALLDSLQQIRNEKGMATDAKIWQPYTSQRPRYQEGARYWLQYAGMPDSLVYFVNKQKVDYSFRGSNAAQYAKNESGKEDYKDDYMSRGEWVDYLMGAPNGPAKDPMNPGLKLPIDMALAFHTDAGITPDSTTIGILGIYDTTYGPDTFPNGQSRWASRDLCDIVMTEVTKDLRQLHAPKWSRRGMWNKQYSEAFRPKVPTMLSELLSHQNFADMVLATDPRFKFTVSRAYYKGILKFLSAQNGTSYTVQPLPVNHFRIDLKGNGVQLSWKAVIDPLEPTATPTAYRIYTRTEEHGFDNGFTVSDTTVAVPNLKPGVIYSFKITAVNSGGESFPSEILACSLPEKDGKVALVVNGFDRICAPAAFDNGEKAGFLTNEDEGVGYQTDIAFVGEQYDFDRKSPWLDNDAPGFGAVYSDHETTIKPGNTFDYTLIHGKALRSNGLGFVSMSDEAFERQNWDKEHYTLLDLIFGEEKSTQNLYGYPNRDFTIFTPAMQKAIGEFIHGDNAKILISGAYIGTDLALCNDTLAKKFAAEKLHYKPITNHASRLPVVVPVGKWRTEFDSSFNFNSEPSAHLYKVEAPDAIEAVGNGAETIFRYGENNKGAAVGFSGNYRSVVMGFPFETVDGDETKDKLMKQILLFLNVTDNK